MPKTFALKHGCHELPVIDQMVIGRSAVCDVVLGGDPKVSRLHARISVHGKGLEVEDLQSSNGVFVNGQRIRGRTGLKVGDMVRVGSHQLLLVERDGPIRRALDTIPEMPTVKVTMPALAFEGEPLTEQVCVSERGLDWEPLRAAIESGELDRATTLLRLAFDQALDSASETGRLDPIVQSQICEYAMALTAKTKDGFWLNMLFHLHMLLIQPLPHAASAVVPQLVHDVEGLDVKALEAYVQVLRKSNERLTPVQRRLCLALETALVMASKSSR